MTRLHRLYGSFLANKRRSDVNIVDDLESLENTKELSRENRFPEGEEPDQQSMSELPRGMHRRLEGQELKYLDPHSYMGARMAAKFTPAFKNTVTDEIIESPGFHDIGLLPEEDADAHADLQDFESRYPMSDEDAARAGLIHKKPHSVWLDGFVSESGDFYTREEAAQALNDAHSFLLSEDLPEKEAIGLIEGPVSDENKYTDNYGRADSAIPRPHHGRVANVWPNGEIYPAQVTRHNITDEDADVTGIVVVEYEIDNSGMTIIFDDPKHRGSQARHGVRLSMPGLHQFMATGIINASRSNQDMKLLSWCNTPVTIAISNKKELENLAVHVDEVLQSHTSHHGSQRSGAVETTSTGGELRGATITVHDSARGDITSTQATITYVIEVGFIGMYFFDPRYRTMHSTSIPLDKFYNTLMPTGTITIPPTSMSSSEFTFTIPKYELEDLAVHVDEVLQST